MKKMKDKMPNEDNVYDPYNRIILMVFAYIVFLFVDVVFQIGIRFDDFYKFSYLVKKIMKFQEKLNKIKGKLFINGEYVDSKGGKMFDVINPATEEVICQTVAATKEDVDHAAKCARKAFQQGEWRAMDDANRGRIIYKFADLIEQNAEWLGYFETLNNGKPLKGAQTQDLPFSASIYRYFAGCADKIKGQTIMMSKPFYGMTRKQPVGVVGQIIPWNYPLLMMCWKVAPALAAGCTIILKPAQQTPLTALMLGDLINEAGFPPGVVNILPGFGQAGEAVAQHPEVNKVSFTGSTQVGYLVMRNSHKHALKKITLQLGGKSANIIFPDADIDEAVEQACIVFSNAGQSCVAGTRTFVHQQIYDQFIKRAINIAEGIIVGDPMKEETQQGAQISKQQFDKILYYIAEGQKQGAKIVTGGKRVGEKGYFIQPTIFVDVEDHMKIARQEIFGPVMSILKWKEEDEVIKRANQLPYGLGAGIVTKNIDKIINFTQKLKAGTVYVNCYDYQEGSTPFGGYKDSGIGKDLGDEGIEGYLETKTIIIKPKI